MSDRGYGKKDSLKGLLNPRMNADEILEIEIKPLKEGSRGAQFATVENLTRVAYLFMMGHTTAEIAEQMAVSHETVKRARTTPEFKAILHSLNQEIASAARMFMSSATLKATKVMLTLLDSEDERIQMSAAKDILDRTGVKQNDVLEVVDKRDAHIDEMTREELSQLLKLGIKELGPVLQKHNENIRLVEASEEDRDGYKQ